jgi:uncharacterized protein (TIGR00251 family)
LSERPYRLLENGLLLFIRLTPKASRARIGEVRPTADGGSCLSVQVTAPPEKGKANEQLVRLLAKEWRLPPGDFSIESGGKSRQKSVRIAGDPKALARILDGWRGGKTP